MAARFDQLYETDFYAWTQDQAAALRRLAERRWNGPLDLARLAEEVEDLGKSEQNAVRSQLRRLIEHCLKLEFSPAREPRLGWQISIDNARDEMRYRLSPAIRRDLDELLPALHAQARRTAYKALLDHGEQEAVASLSTVTSLYALDDLLTDDWYPASRHGLQDATDIEG